MSDEITAKMSLQVKQTGEVAKRWDLGSILADLAGSQDLRNRQTVGITEEALLLGDVVAGGWLICLNRDANNFVSLRAASGETNFAKMLPGEGAMFRLSPDATAPFAIADTAAVELEFWIWEA